MLPKSLQNLIEELSKLPDIGPRAATRLAFYLLNQKNEEIQKLINAFINLKKIKFCSQCFNFSEGELCDICKDQKRDKSKICVVETALDIIPIEKTRAYNGLYHVLGGVISPSNGIGPDKLKIRELIERIKKLKTSNLEHQTSNIIEIILALNPTTEGDTTTLYLERLLTGPDFRGEKIGIKITRLARGLSKGSSLEYIDEDTLKNAMLGRR